MKNLVQRIDWKKCNDLIPAIIQNNSTKIVLMLGYMNRESLEKTLQDKQVCFFSRTKNRLWTKGETSGNFLEVLDIKLDCDNDTLLVQAKPKGPTCHTGNISCFFDDSEIKSSLSLLNELYELIKTRKKELPEGSYTAMLFQKGIDKIAQKVGEEAVEVVIDAKNDNKEAFTNEVADLLFHLMILLVEKNVTIEEVLEILEKRKK